MAALIVPLTSMASFAEPFSEAATNELVVLLRPMPHGPPVQDVVDAINGGGPIPGGLGEGNPQHAERVAPPAKGRLLALVQANPESAEARLQRFVVLRYNPNVNIDAIANALSHNPNVQNVERPTTASLHASAATKTHTTTPTDPLAGPANADPAEGQWGLHLLNLPAAWPLATGHGTIGFLDVGLMVAHEDLVPFGSLPSGQLALGPFRQHLSDDLAHAGCGVDELEGGGTTAGHGTHVSGLAAGSSNNGRGVAGSCWGCGIAMIELNASNPFQVSTAFLKLLTAGAQAISMSFGLAQAPCPPDDPGFFCVALQAAANRDALLVASAGNDLLPVEFPANDSKVLGVGGLEWIGVDNDDPEHPKPLAQHWNMQPNCPLPPDIANNIPTPECGSNSGPELDLTAPAQEVLSSVYTGVNHNAALQCGDSYHPALGYGLCTGTSMSAPYVAGVGLLVRSVNPLLGRDAVTDILTATASAAGNHTDELGFGHPDAEAAVKSALGSVNGKTLPNRLTPLFSFFGTTTESDPAYQRSLDWAYTTVPTLASGLLMPLDTPFGEAVDPYATAIPTGLPKLVPGYGSFPGIPSCDLPCETVPRASIYLFTTSRPPFAGAPALVPLYRLRYDPDIFRSCDGTLVKKPGQDFAYVTTAAEVQSFKITRLDAAGIGYDLDAIEGYLFASCEGQPGCIAPAGTVKVYRAYNSARYDFAIFPEDELPSMQAAGYVLETVVLGYAYPNFDTDGDSLTDGFELLINTDASHSDTDCDGASDGAEIMEYDTLNGQYGDPLSGPCWPLGALFANSFESGDTSRWSAVAP